MRTRFQPKLLFACSLAVYSILAVGVDAQEIPEIFSAWGFDQNRDYFSPLPYEHVDPMTGNLLLTHTDLVLPGYGGFDLRIQRTYNSKVYPNFPDEAIPNEMDSWAGIGWSMHIARIENWLTPNPVIVMGDGSSHPTFAHTDTSVGDWITKDYWVLVNDPSEPILKLPNGRVYKFGKQLGSTKYVTEIEDPFGNRVEIEYADGTIPSEPLDGIHRLRQFLGASIRTLNFFYESGTRSLSRLQLVSGSTHTWTYQHSPWSTTFSFLTRVDPPVAPSWKYDYNTTSGSKTHELTRLTAPSGGYVDYFYGTVSFSQPANSSQTQARAVVQRKTGPSSKVPVGTWTYSYAQGSKKNQSVFTSPCNTVTYTYKGIGTSGIGANAWETGLLEKKQLKVGQTVLETEEYTWEPSALISFAAVTIGASSDPNTFVPLIKSRTIQRGSKSYVTTNIYGTSDFNDYGRPWKVTEAGDRTRVTEFEFDYGFPSHYIVDKIEEVRTKENGETWVKHFVYNNDGFKTQDNIYGVITNYAPDPFGNVSSAQDALGHTTTFSYRWGVLEDTFTPKYTIDRSISGNGTVASVKRNGHTWTFSYDPAMRIKQVKPPTTASSAHDIEYDSAGTFFRVKRGASSWRRTDLDGYGRRHYRGGREHTWSNGSDPSN